MSSYDVVLVGGGPAGLAAALTLGRAGRRVLVCDAGPPRNAAAIQVHNFVTRDGTPPAEFRRIAREQLHPYTSVEVQDARVESIRGERNAFEVTTVTGMVRARRIILCTGMIDEGVDLPGFAEAWGHAVFQCPYCHGWEVRGRRWGYLALEMFGLQHGFPLLLRSWTDDVVVFTNAELEIPAETADELRRAGIRIESRPIARLVGEGGALAQVELADGGVVPCEILYAHPRQQHVEVVRQLGLDLDALGYVQIDPMTRQTSMPGVYAAGDLTTRAQGAIFAAATGAQAAGMVTNDLCRDLAP